MHIEWKTTHPEYPVTMEFAEGDLSTDELEILNGRWSGHKGTGSYYLKRVEDNQFRDESC